MGAGGEPLQIDRRVHVAVVMCAAAGAGPGALAERELVVTQATIRTKFVGRIPAFRQYDSHCAFHDHDGARPL